MPNLLVEYVMRNTHVPVGLWRGVTTNQNAVYMECFIEECARAAGRTRSNSAGRRWPSIPGTRGAECGCREGDWGILAAGVHRGIAQFMGYGSYSAATAEFRSTPRAK